MDKRIKSIIANIRDTTTSGVFSICSWLSWKVHIFPQDHSRYYLLFTTCRRYHLENEFIPAITGGNQCSDKERDLLALPVRLGGLGLENITKISTREYESSRKMTKSLLESVIEQQIIFEVQEEEQKKLKLKLRKIVENIINKILTSYDNP